MIVPVDGDMLIVTSGDEYCLHEMEDDGEVIQEWIILRREQDSTASWESKIAVEDYNYRLVKTHTMYTTPPLEWNEWEIVEVHRVEMNSKNLAEASDALDKALREDKARSTNPPNIFVLKVGVYGCKNSMLVRAFDHEVILIREVEAYGSTQWRSSVSLDTEPNAYTPMGLHDSLIDALKSIQDSACYYEWVDEAQAKVHGIVKKGRGW